MQDIQDIRDIPDKSNAPKDRPPPIHPSWRSYLKDEFSSPAMGRIRSFLADELERGKVIYPHGKNIFSALGHTSFDKLKVVIIGQDPYHGPRQAHGLCFSVRPGVRPPPSLVNIFREQQQDLGITQPPHGCLTSWAGQGVLLLNNVLTVEAGKAGGHRNRGWEEFTDKVVAVINTFKENVVFLLWGSAAQQKGQMIDPLHHHILKAPHPSPLSAHRGFLGCRHFSKTNQILRGVNRTPINWQLPENPSI